MTPAVTVSLNFMPAFYAKHTGIKYGEAYYFDPEHRAMVECAESRFLHDCLGRYDVGSANPHPSTSLFIQPVDLIMRTQGAEWRLPDDATLESWGSPWSNLSIAEIEALDPVAAAHHPIIDTVINQYREMEKLYGAKADLFGTKQGVMGIHSPYTTAHQLYGEELFILMFSEPEAAKKILAKVWEIYEAVYARVVSVTGGVLERVHIGDCSASLLSEDLYRRVVLPVNQKIASGFKSAGYHSCGPSTHLLGAFSELPGVDWMELGPGTDLDASVSMMPDRVVAPLVDPTVIRGGSADDVRKLVAGMLEDTAKAPAVTLCAWSFDRDTRIENVATLYETVGSFLVGDIASAAGNLEERI